MKTFTMATLFVVLLTILASVEGWLFDICWPFDNCDYYRPSSVEDAVAITPQGNLSYAYDHTSIKQTPNASIAGTQAQVDTVTISPSSGLKENSGNHPSQGTPAFSATVEVIQDVLVDKNISDMVKMVGDLDTISFSDGEKKEIIRAALNSAAALNSSSAYSKIVSDDWISFFDNVAKNLDKLDQADIEIFMVLATDIIVDNLDKEEGNGSNRTINAVLVIERYVVESTFRLLNAYQDGQTEASYSLRNVYIFTCKGTCKMKSESVEFDIMESGELTYTFLEHKNLPQTSGSLASSVVSVTAQDINKVVVSTNVRFVVKRNKDLSSLSGNPNCGFIDTSSLQWSTHGCKIMFSNSSHTGCNCNHTTSFAILLMHSDVQLSAEDEFWFSMLTFVGCGISITALTATMTIFVVLGLHRTERAILLWKLCFCLCSAQLVLVAGTTARIGTVECKLIAILLHFFFTASFSWMLMEGVYLYLKASNATRGRYRFRFIIAVGWFIPATIVVVAVASNLNGYGFGKACWLSIESGFVWAFVAPAIGIIAINCIVLGFVIKVFLGLKVISKTNERDRIKRATKAVLLLMPLLGITWIFGLLAFDSATKWFLYLFCICNSLQGLAIFIFQCAKNDEVRKAFFKKYRRSFVSIGSFSSPGNSSNNRTCDTNLDSKYNLRSLPTVAKW